MMNSKVFFSDKYRSSIKQEGEEGTRTSKNVRKELNDDSSFYPLRETDLIEDKGTDKKEFIGRDNRRHFEVNERTEENIHFENEINNIQTNKANNITNKHSMRFPLGVIHAGLALVFNLDPVAQNLNKKAKDQKTNRNADKGEADVENQNQIISSGRDMINSSARRRNFDQLNKEKAAKPPFGNIKTGEEEVSSRNRFLLDHSKKINVSDGPKKDKKNQQSELENEESSKQSLFSKFLDSNLVTYTYSIIIVVSIFGDDLRRISIMKKYDYFMDIPLLLILTLFVCEIIYNGIIRKSAYLLSIDILLDVLATLSILFDVAFFFEGFLAPYEK